MGFGRGLGAAALALVLIALGAPAADAAKLERHRVELSEFAGSSRIFTSHEVFPSCAGTDVVTDGSLEGTFSSPLSGVAGVKIGKSDAKGTLRADGGLANYTQAGIRSGDRAPCSEDDTQPFELSCARPVPTVPGIVGRVVDATKKKVEVQWQPAFDGAEGRFTPDFFCIEQMGRIPMPTTPLTGLDTCEERQYPRKFFERDSGVFELEVTCALEIAPFQTPGSGAGAFGGTYRAQLTIEAVEE
jgi:hypothetical protein